MSRVSLSEADKSLVQLSSSSLLDCQDVSSLSSLCAGCGPVSSWTLDDVQRHIFLLVWVCGIPVHVRYVAHLMERSTAVTASTTAAAAAAPQRGTASSPTAAVDAQPSLNLWAAAQREVLQRVWEHGARVAAALQQWPASRAFEPRAASHSVLVPLGVEESGDTTHSGVVEPTGEIQAAGLQEGTNRAASRATGATAVPTVRGVAVTPAVDFTNVSALALYAPGEGGADAGLGEVPSLWCSRAYWTAVAHAQQCIAHHVAADSGVGQPPATAALPLLCCETPPTLVPASVSAGRKRPRPAAASRVIETVVIDAEGEEEVVVSGTAQRAASAAAGGPRSGEEVIVIDSDDDD